MIVRNAGHWVFLLVHFSVFFRQNVHLADTTISTCGEHLTTIGLFSTKHARHESGHAISVILEVINVCTETIFTLVLYDTIGLDDGSRADVPESHCAIATTRVADCFIITDPDRLNHACMSAALQNALDVLRPHIDHM